MRDQRKNWHLVFALFDFVIHLHIVVVKPCALNGAVGEELPTRSEDGAAGTFFVPRMNTFSVPDLRHIIFKIGAVFGFKNLKAS